MWPRSTEVGDLPAKPEKTAVSAGIEAHSEEIPEILLSDDNSAPEVEIVAENEPTETDIAAEEKTEPAPQSEPARAVSKLATASSEPKSGDKAIINGKPHIWIPGFGWIVDEGGGSVGTTIGNPGDELIGYKVGQMGGGTVAEDMYENGHKIGIMGGAESAPSNSPPLPSELPESTGDVIYIPLQPPVTKDSTSPPYKPSGEPINP
ncbi:MAG: hypothetical protein GX434_12470 [Peptococcaceae bacterium]|nr:hypothetical protein [Peptococcaceae bacterium]